MGIHLPINFIATKYHLAIHFPLHPHLNLHIPTLIPRFIYLLNTTIQHFNLYLDSHRLIRLRCWTTTTRPFPTWFVDILLAQPGRPVGTQRLPGLLPRQWSLRRCLNIHNRKLHLLQPRHHHLHQARHHRHPLQDLRPLPNARLATFPDTGWKPPHQDLEELPQPDPSCGSIFTTTCTHSTTSDT